MDFEMHACSTSVLQGGRTDCFRSMEKTLGTALGHSAPKLMKALRILIVDDHEVIRRGLRSLLSSRPEWEICGEAADGRTAIERATALRPDVILMDVTMPEISGTESARVIHREVPEARVIIISQNDPKVTRRQA